MKDVRLNISGSYEDAGWQSQLFCINDQKDGWVNKFGDVRGEMGYLNTQDAYRVIDAEQGTYYSVIFKNSACTREGFLQVSLFIPAGKRANEKQIAIFLQVLKEIYKLICDDVELIKALFDGPNAPAEGQKKLVVLKEKAQSYVDGLETAPDYKIEGRKPFGTPKSKTVYRKYEDEKFILEYFKNPHQDVNVDYKSVYLIKKSASPKEEAIEITEPLHRVFEIKNGKEVYFILEGNSFEIPLTSQPQMEPKKWLIEANGKDTGVYKFVDNCIIVNESNIHFTRDFCLTVQKPDDCSPDERFPEFTIKVENLTELPTKKKENDVYQYCFKAHLKTKKVTLEGSHIETTVINIDPSVQGTETVKLTLAKRDIEFDFIYNGKSIKLPAGTTVKVDNTRVHPIDGKYSIPKLSIAEKHIIDVNSDSYELSGKGEFRANQHIVRIELKNKATQIYINLGSRKSPLYLQGETDNINEKDKKIFGYVIKREDINPEMGDCKILVTQTIWKTMAIILGIFAFVFFLASLFLGYQLIKEKEIERESTTLSEEQGNHVAKIDSLETQVPDTMEVVDTTNNNSSYGKVN